MVDKINSIDEILDWKNKIDKMSQIEMCKMVRFSRVGHPCFDTTLPLNERFQKRFKELGGMTPEISKLIGWE